MINKLIKPLLVLVLAVSLVSFQSESADAASRVMWGKTELKLGQIGKATILSDTTLVKLDSNGSLSTVRSMKKGEEYRVYSYKSNHGGLYGVGGGSYIQKNAKVKYESPSKKKLAILESYKNITTPGKTYPDGWTAPVLKSKWKKDHNYTRSVFEKELGLEDGWLYSIHSAYRILYIGMNDEDMDAMLVLRIWHTGDSNFKESYRVPIISNELFKYYFEDEAEQIFNYYQNGYFPDDPITVNNRMVFFQVVPGSDKLLMHIGYPNQPFSLEKFK